MDVFGLRDQLVRDDHWYHSSITNIHDHDILAIVNTELPARVLWPGPLIHHSPSFEFGAWIDGLIDGRILHDGRWRFFSAVTAFPIVQRKEEEAHGEYRTKRDIHEIYDAMAKATPTGAPCQTRFDPPPADPRVAHPASSISQAGAFQAQSDVRR